jgi:modulator of FtsH protease HflK
MDKNVIDISNVKLPQLSPKIVLIVLGVIAGLAILGGTFYQVETEEVAVVIRFGAYSRTEDPGLRMKIPFLEDVLKVPVQRQLKQEFGFRTEAPGVRTQYARGSSAQEESVMLTGDLNVAVVEWIVQYRVDNPYNFLFKVRGPEETFRGMTEAVMRQVVGNRTVTEVLTVGRQEIEITVQGQLQEMCREYEIGITVEQVVLQDVNPPDPVKPSWDQVNQAQQQRDRMINEARGEYNQVIPRARGEAQQTILQAEGYALDRVNRARGDGVRFNELYFAYRQAPEVTRRRMYLETVAKVLPRLGGKIFMDKDAEGIIPLLPLESLGNLGTRNRNRDNNP